MSEQLLRLGDHDLRGIATALRSGRLAPPFTTVAVGRYVSTGLADGIAAELQAIASHGFTAPQLAAVIDLLLKDRSQRVSPEEIIHLVTSGPEAGGVTNRDTAVVVRELFSTADESVLVAGYAVYQGQRVFQALADRMRVRPTLKVRMFLDVRRNAGESTAADEVVRRFADRFRRFDWPQDAPLPEVIHYPQSLEESPDKRAALHAKCIVVDCKRVFVSSANFTEAAQVRNIEVGLLIDSPSLADGITKHFGSMLGAGLLRPVFA